MLSGRPENFSDRPEFGGLPNLVSPAASREFKFRPFGSLAAFRFLGSTLARLRQRLGGNQNLSEFLDTTNRTGYWVIGTLA
jgi:hypothetical protein